MDIAVLEDKIMKGLSAEYVKAVDESGGCGAKIIIVAVSRYICYNKSLLFITISEFNGKPILQQHRMIHKVYYFWHIC